MGVVLNQIFHHAVRTRALGNDRGQLVALPVLDSFDALWKPLRFPDWSYVSTPAAWATAATLAVIASIETLLCLESTDRMDPERRTFDKNHELLAQGIGNVTASLFGGIPMTSVIVCSSANIYAGARSRWSTSFHGGLLLVAVVVLADVLNQVPLASLSAVLLIIGAKLARPATFRDAWRSGQDPFVPFITTVVATRATDLLKGVLIGTGVGLRYARKKSWEVAVREERRGDRLQTR
jgi:MFS superfamily sulfate permease-like transporter